MAIRPGSPTSPRTWCGPSRIGWRGGRPGGLEEACDATAQPACPEPAHPLPSGACLVLPEHADPALPVAIYLHGMIAHPGFAHGEWMQLARIAGDRLALLLPLGRKGECAWSPEYEEHLCWPTMPQRKAALDALVAELQADLEEVRRRLGREGAITPFLVGYSNGGVGAFQIAASTEMPLAGLFRMTTESAILRTFVRVVEEVRAIPYRWPGKPDAEAVRREGYGTCASKHALLAERLREADIESAPLLVSGRLVPAFLQGRKEFAEAAELLEVHECLTVFTPWAGPLVVDVTWDPPLLARGLPGAPDWSGREDMPFAVEWAGGAWAVPRKRLRAAKEAIRRRLYTPEERRARDRALHRMSALFEEWRR